MKTSHHRSSLVSRNGRSTSHLHSHPTVRRRLGFESLEDRRLLAITVDTLLDVVDADDGVTSLREAITTTNSTSEDTIDFSVTGKIDLMLGELEVTDTLTLTGPGQDLLTIDAQQLSRLINFTSPIGTTGNDDLIITGLTLTGGLTDGDNTVPSGSEPNTFSGGGIRFLSNATLILRDSILTGNSTSGDYAKGGSIYSRSGDVIVYGSLVQGNSTIGVGAHGGGVYTRTGKISLQDTTIANNHVVGRGPGLFSGRAGGLYSKAGTISVDSGHFFDNTDISNLFPSGGIVSETGPIQLTGDIELQNSRIASLGGDISVVDTRLQGEVRLRTSGGNITLIDSSISGDDETREVNSHFGAILLNNSTFEGDQLYSEHDSVTLKDSTLAGGRIFTRYATVELLRSTISGSVDGAIETFQGDITVRESVISENSSPASGAAISTRIADVTIIGSEISGNQTTGSEAHGGAVSSNSGNVTIVDSTLSNNTASGSNAKGGAIFANSGSVDITNSTLSGNTSGSHGGGLYAWAGRVLIQSSTVIGNAAAGVGGGISNDPTDSSNSDGLTILNSIVSGNTDDGTAPDLITSYLFSQTQYSLVSDNTGTQLNESADPDDSGNLVGGPNGGVLDPLLGPLQDNGGLTETHLPLSGSPVVDAGEMAAANLLEYDQRGFAFERIVGDRIDMGALEFGASSADFDTDGDIDGADFLAWQRGFDTLYDGNNLLNWENSFGNMSSLPSLVQDNQVVAMDSAAHEKSDELATSTTTADALLTKAAIAWKLLDESVEEDSIALEETPITEQADRYQNLATGGLAPTAFVESGDHFASTNSETEDEPTKNPWLDEDLLERVFGWR